MGSVWGRIEKVIAAGFVENENQWLKKAGLSRGYFSSKRNEEAEKKRPVGFTAETFEKLANAAGVSLLWLQTGKGSMRIGESDTAPDPNVPDVLYVKIVTMEPPSLRLALAEFYARYRDAEARSTCDQFVFQKYKKGEREKSKDEWAAEILMAYRARKEAYDNPWGPGAMPFGD